MSPVLDHLLWAAPDLDAGIAAVEALTGIRPALGGVHEGFGTHNALLSLGPGVYLEIIAPDPRQGPQAGRPLAAAIAARGEQGLMTFAVRASSLHATARRVTAAGLAVTGPVAMRRQGDGGTELAWSVLHVDAPLGLLQPFYIDWHGCPHPAHTTPRGCLLTRFVVLHPDPVAVRAAYAPQHITLDVAGASRPGLVAELRTPRGPVWLTG